jgi:hypothetical protein
MSMPLAKDPALNWRLVFMALLLNRLIITALSFLPAISVRAQDRIPLQIDWPAAADVAFPVYCGLSFPKGLVQKAGQISVINGDGKMVPAEIEPLAKWIPDASLKWVGLHFLARKNETYFAVQTPSEAKARVVVQYGVEGIVIDTGAARFELLKKGPLIGKV